MQDVIAQVLAIARGALRYRWAAIGTAWGICLLGWGLVVLMPNLYEARAKMYVDTESVLKPLLVGLAVNGDVSNQLNMVRAVVMSRPNLERIAKETGLAQRVPNQLAFDAMIAELPRSIGLVQSGSDNTFLLSFRDPDRATAQRVVEAMLASFVADSVNLKTSDTAGAQRFLETQIAEYERRLRDAENKLADFKQRNVGVMPGEGGDYYARLQAELDKSEALRAKLATATGRRTELQRQLDGEEPTFGLMGTTTKGGGTGPIDSQIAELNRQLDALLVQYTEKHPNVVSLREQVEQLEARKKAGVKAVAAAPRPAADASQVALRALDVNPVYQQMRLSLSTTEVEISDLRSQLGQQQEIVNDLRSKVDTMPRVEAELAQLNRDYEVNRAQYTALLQRLESARLSDDARRSSDHVKFRIIEPPKTPPVPAAPHRSLLFAVILVLGVGIGLAAAVGLHLIHPVFSDRNQLRSVTQLPVLGSITDLVGPEPRNFLRRETTLFVGAAAALPVAFVGLVLLTMMNVRRLVSP